MSDPWGRRAGDRELRQAQAGYAARHVVCSFCSRSGAPLAVGGRPACRSCYEDCTRRRGRWAPVGEGVDTGAIINPALPTTTEGA